MERHAYQRDFALMCYWALPFFVTIQPHRTIVILPQFQN